MIKAQIAFDATILTSKGMDGLNRYTGELLHEFMSKQKDFIAYTALPEIQTRFGENVKLVPKVLNEYGFKGNLFRLLWHQANLRASLESESISVFYSPVPEGMLYPVCKQIITVHDILPLLFTEVYPRIKYYFRFILPRLIKASNAVIVDSKSTKKDIEKHYNISDKPIHVIYPGYGDNVFRPTSVELVKNTTEKYGLQEYILCVGETRPYKNIRRLIKAFARVPLPSLKLAIVGKLNRLDKDLLGLPQQLGIPDKVKFLGYVPDEDLAALYGGAGAFVFPSLYEGFGIPPLEAMACGCPVVVSDAASLPEVCGDAACYVDPYDTDSIAEGIYKVIVDADLGESLRNKGLERVKAFSYRKTADEIMKIINGFSE